MDQLISGRLVSQHKLSSRFMATAVWLTLVDCMYLAGVKNYVLLPQSLRPQVRYTGNKGL